MAGQAGHTSATKNLRKQTKIELVQREILFKTPPFVNYLNKSVIIE